MSNAAEKRAEDLYLDVFGVVAANGDFVEPEEGVDLLLAETFIAQLAMTVLTAFLTAFFGELTKAFLDKVRRRPFRHGELVETEPEVLIAELARKMGDGELDAARMFGVRADVALTLQKLGVAEEVGDRITSEILAAVERHRHVR